MWSEKKISLAIFLHRVLAVWKREILLPFGSKASSREKLGAVELWRVTGNTVTAKRKKREILGTILVNNRKIPVYLGRGYRMVFASTCEHVRSPDKQLWTRFLDQRLTSLLSQILLHRVCRILKTLPHFQVSRHNSAFELLTRRPDCRYYQIYFKTPGSSVRPLELTSLLSSAIQVSSAKGSFV